uniref:EF-hand domain-containing protein n=1 Tax=Globodera rostochiensis TaxID=31243 RepID=A0A914H3E2_GLORO
MAFLTLRMALLLVFAALLVVQCSSDSSEYSSDTSDESSNGGGLAPAGPPLDNSAFPPFSASNAGLARKKRSVDKACCLAEKTGLGCPNSRKRHALEQPKREATAVFQQADADGDGALNIEEAVHYLVSNWNMTESELTSPSTRHWFSELDLNHNNKLEPNEIDAALTL